MCGLHAIARAWALVVRRRVVRLVVVRIVMRLRIERVIAVVSLRSWVVIILVGASCVWDVLYRVLYILSAFKCLKHSPALFSAAILRSQRYPYRLMLLSPAHNHVHLVVEAAGRQTLLLGWVPWESRECPVVVRVTHSGLLAGSPEEAAQGRAYGLVAVADPSRTGRHYHLGGLH
jgi:hypothetical protein